MLIWKYEHHARPNAKRLIVALHGYGQVFETQSTTRRVLENLRDSGRIDEIGDAAEASVLYPYAVGGDWWTSDAGGYFQRRAIFAEIERFAPGLPICWIGFSDGATMAHACAARHPRTESVVIYSGPLRGLDHLTPRGRYLLCRNSTEVVASEEWRERWRVYMESRGVPADMMTGWVQIGRWAHYWDYTLNGRIAAWIRGERTAPRWPPSVLDDMPILPLRITGTQQVTYHETGRINPPRWEGLGEAT